MTNQPTFKAYRLSVQEPDERAGPNGFLNLHYLAKTTSPEAAIEAVRQSRPKPCTVELIDDDEATQDHAARIRLANGQITAI